MSELVKNVEEDVACAVTLTVLVSCAVTLTVLASMTADVFSINAGNLDGSTEISCPSITRLFMPRAARLPDSYTNCTNPWHYILWRDLISYDI